MALAQDLQILVERGMHYGFQPDTVKEFPHFIHDLMLGASLPKKNPSYTYVDLHVHIPRTVNMQRLIHEASKRVDVCAIVTREPKYDADGGYLDFDTAVEKIKRTNIPIISETRSHINLKYNNRLFTFIRGIEVYSKDGQELVIIGNDKEFKDNRVNDTSLDNLILEAKDLGSLCFLDHPFSLQKPGVHFSYPTSEEENRLRRWIEKHNPIIEVGNHQNTLWMYPSNIAARRLAKEYSSPSIAGSDSHFRLAEIGLSRTILPTHKIIWTGDNFISSLTYNIKNKDEVQIDSGYSSIWAFSQFMVLPTIFWKLGMHRTARMLRGIED